MSSNGGTARRVCLLTGAGGTLGNAFCRQHRAEYDILAVYRNRPPNTPSQDGWLVDPLDPAADLADNEHPVYTLQADLTRDEDIARVVDVAVARFGAVDLLVNAAARSTREQMLEPARYRRSLLEHFTMNVAAPVALTAALAAACWQDRPQENERRNCNVVNVSSTAGLFVYPNLRQSAYSTSKAALNILTCHMAEEFAPLRVRVNASAPNTFPGRIPLRRVLDSVIRFDTGSMNGEIFVVDEDGDSVA